MQGVGCEFGFTPCQVTDFYPLVVLYHWVGAAWQDAVFHGHDRRVSTTTLKYELESVIQDW